MYLLGTSQIGTGQCVVNFIQTWLQMCLNSVNCGVFKDKKCLEIKKFDRQNFLKMMALIKYVYIFYQSTLL